MEKTHIQILAEKLEKTARSQAVDKIPKQIESISEWLASASKGKDIEQQKLLQYAARRMVDDLLDVKQLLG